MAKRRGKSHHEEEEAGEAWLLPYSDLMTLLLAVFIVLFAVSQQDPSKATAAAQAFRGMLMPGGVGVMDSGSIDAKSIVPPPDVFVAPITSPEQQKKNAEAAAAREKSNMTQIQNELKTYFQKEHIESQVSTSIDERGLVISLNNSILFDSGRADIKPVNQDVLVKIGNSIGTLDNYIRVEGHTDTNPINTAVYPSNWELSGARSARVVRLFADRCNIKPDKMVAVGYGEFRPVASNDTPEGMAKNRRVDVIVLNAKYNGLEEDQMNDVPKDRQPEGLPTAIVSTATTAPTIAPAVTPVAVQTNMPAQSPLPIPATDTSGE